MNWESTTLPGFVQDLTLYGLNTSKKYFQTFAGDDIS